MDEDVDWKIEEAIRKLHRVLRWVRFQDCKGGIADLTAVIHFLESGDFPDDDED